MERIFEISYPKLKEDLKAKGWYSGFFDAPEEASGTAVGPGGGVGGGAGSSVTIQVSDE